MSVLLTSTATSLPFARRLGQALGVEVSAIDRQDWGEWRSTGGQTLIHGEVMDRSKGETSPTPYRLLNEARPIEMAFDEIVWPDYLKLPWRSGAVRLANCTRAQSRLCSGLARASTSTCIFTRAFWTP